ncbi:MAG: hypothetical protein C0392_11325 [Syntrophus sp. (in: bacteria)]|nr:hypothetical protein [Syntrophus sp. (in: bacteria)]
MNSRLISREDKRDDRGMEEKYFHSMGAFLCDEGRLDEAIDFFCRALALKEEPYTHYHLSLAYTGKMEFEEALREISRAIEMNPSVPEYYLQRSHIRYLGGDKDKASTDYEKACEIDGNCRRIEEIKRGAELIEAQLKDRSILEASCPVVSCPAYCCHFSGDLVRHGVHIGPWKLRAIRAFLKENGLPEEDFIDRLPYSGEEHIQRLVPPNYILREQGQQFIYYPKRGDETMNEALLKDLPKGTDYRTLVWIADNARPCAFLNEKRCMIYNAGDENGLEACKQFLCLTGFVFATINHLKIIDERTLNGKTMGELNSIALEALLILSRGVYDNEELISFLQHRGFKARMA